MLNAPSSDLSSGINTSREFALRGAAELERLAEKFLLGTDDPKLDIGLWLYRRARQDDFGICEDQVLISLAGDQGQLWMFVYRRPAPDERPAGANLKFRCIMGVSRLLKVQGRLPPNAFELERGNYGTHYLAQIFNLPLPGPSKFVWNGLVRQRQENGGTAVSALNA